MKRKCSQVQKRSKYISKTVNVTSVTQFQFCDAMRILFVCKENKNLLHFKTMCDWAYALGWLMALSSILLVPGWVMGRLLAGKGSLKQVRMKVSLQTEIPSKQ